MYYADDLVRDVLAANDIVDIISRYVTLKKSGRGFVGLCPFHNEKTPSFHVSPDKQLYHCFGCGEGGSVVNFVMKAENLDFVEALKYLADNANITLPEPDQHAPGETSHKNRQRNLSANTLAAKFFYSSLLRPEGKAGLAYFSARGFVPRTITSFGLGFAPDTRDALLSHLKTYGYEPSELVDFGLAVIKGDSYVDKFRNRVMFPIIDVRGNVIGFGGRVMDDSKPKYLNSPDTPVFNKSQNLFALNFAKNGRDDTLILVEGYMDVISLHQAGVRNVIATLGTALTVQQSRLIARYAKNVVLCYDTDEAGIKATLRAIEIFADTDVRVRVLNLPGVKDPDEFIKKHGGSEMFLTCLKKAIPATQYRLNLLSQRYDVEHNIDDKVRFFAEAAKILLSTHNMVEVDTYAEALAQQYNIKKEFIYTELAKLQTTQQRFEKRRQAVKRPVVRAAPVAADKLSERPDSIEERVSPRILTAERSLLALIFTNRAAARRAESELAAPYFSTDLHRQLAQLCYDAWQRGRPPDSATIAANFEGEQERYVSEVLFNPAVYDDPLAAAEDLLRNIQLEKLTQMLKQETDPAVNQKLLQKIAKLKAQRGGSPI